MKLGTMRTCRLVTLGLVAFCGIAHSATVNFSGHFRGEATSYNHLGLGLGGNQSKTFLGSRALLNPNLVIDDHFSIKSQWSLLTSPFLTPNATQPLGGGQGAWIMGDPRTAGLVLGRAWMEWTSDVGVFRLGRMPVSWGYGVVYDAGDGIWDDFQSTLDRLEYRLHLGYVVGALAYSKGRKMSVLGNDDDQEFYAAYLRYDNPEVEVEAGLLFEKQKRAPGQGAGLLINSPYTQPSTVAAGAPALNYPLAIKTPWPVDNNLLDLYIKKTTGGFTYGGEVAWINGNSTDFDGDGAFDKLNAFGILLNGSYSFRKVKAFLEFIYATGDANLSDQELGGFVLMHRNRRPGLILGRELLGPAYGNNVGQGTPFAYGANGSFSGMMYFRPGVKIDWTSTISSAVELVVARKAVVAGGESSDLGIELDVSGEYAVYKNFRLGIDFGVLAPGAGLGGAAGAGAPFAIRSTASLSF